MVDNRVPTVAVIGTCRVHDTLNEAQSLGLIKLDNGEIIPSRDKLCQIVSNFCENNNIPLFEPAELFQKYEKKDLLAKDGKDLAHYAKSALETVGLSQYNRIIDIYHNINSSD